MSLTARAPHRTGADYESAFFEHLRRRGVVALGIDESRRSHLEGEPLKSMDYLVLSAGGHYIVDIKGKKYPGGPPHRPRRVWENWVFQEDIQGLSRWEETLGDGFAALIVFAYRLDPECFPGLSAEDLIIHQNHRYLFRAVRVADYALRMKRRSPRWDTVDLSRDHYRALVRPLGHFLREPWDEPAVERWVPQTEGMGV